MDNNNSSGLTEEQRQRIAENRRKALEKRAARLQSLQGSSSGVSSNSTPNLQNSVEACSTKLLVNNFYHIQENQTKTPFVTSRNTFFAKPQSFHQIKDTTPPNTSITSDLPSKCILGICTLISRKRFQLEITYHSKVLEACKQIPSRIYDAKEKKWNFSIQHHEMLLTKLKPFAPEVKIKPLPKNVLTIFLEAEEEKSIPTMDFSILEKKLQDSLLPFQREGVAFAIAKNGRALIADDMGLGKTIQAIAITSYYRSDWPVLVVCPSSMRYVWMKEFCEWLPSLNPQDVCVISSAKDDVPDCDVVITSYDIMTRNIDVFVNKPYKITIFDESHFLKNSKSARTKASKQLTKKMSRVLMLSGTPALSRPAELYEQISAVVPKLFPNFHDFGLRYCNAKLAPWGWNYSGCSNMQELQILLEEKVMIRRIKSEVLTQLPSKQRQMVLLDPSALKQHKNKIAAALHEKVKKMEGTVDRDRGLLLQYFQETSKMKIAAVCDYILDLVEGGKKFLCFAHHQIMMSSICEALDKKKCVHIKIDGAVSSENRKILCDKFQNDENCLVAVLSICAANTGITLTAAQLVVFAELFWNPGVLTQAEDRAHRIGQQECVVVQYLVAEGTADDYIWPLVKKKLNILNRVGLSKDNFNDADTVRVTDPLQRLLDDMCETLDYDAVFDDDVAMGSPSSPPKKAKFK